MIGDHYPVEKNKVTFDTHEVLNQPPPPEKYNAYRSDVILQHYIKSFGGEWGEERLQIYGQLVGYELQEAGFDANAYTPKFHSHDRFGHRVDFIKYHPAYHRLMAAAINAGYHNLPWVVQKTGAHVVRAGIEYLHTSGPGQRMSTDHDLLLHTHHQTSTRYRTSVDTDNHSSSL